MTNILLVCGEGASTSLLAQKMMNEAEAQGIEAKIWAVSQSFISQNAPEADVVLVGPQLRFQIPVLKTKVGDNPIDVIDMRAYGRMDGAAVLKMALSMLK